MSTLSKEFKESVACIDIEKISSQWNEQVKTTFDQYLKMPNVSPAYDTAWEENGYIDQVANLFIDWVKHNQPTNSKVYKQKIEGKTPLIIIDIQAKNYLGDDCVLMYGHLDKQPPMTGWRETIEPFNATYIDGLVYGRGSADDGYAMFSSILAIKQLQDNNNSHSRIIIIIEASEESGSPDLIDHLNIIDTTLETPMSDVSLVVCLDSGCLDYKRLWITQSLRGLLQANVTIRVLEEGVHSGGAGGIVPSATHILRELLDRIAKPGSGEILLPEFHQPISQDVNDACKQTALVLDSSDIDSMPFSDGVEPLYSKLEDQLIANTYKPALEIIGIDGLPSISDAGNVLRPYVTVALSFRLPPNVDPMIVASALQRQLTTNVPYSVHVQVEIDSLASGWASPKLQDWLSESFNEVSQQFFSKDTNYMGEGGTIPFMAMLGEKFPKAQFMITGVLGPGSNAHGPNEFLDLDYMFKITACVAGVVIAHGMRNS